LDFKYRSLVQPQPIRIEHGSPPTSENARTALQEATILTLLL